MNNKFISLMLAVVAMLTSFVFTSCGGDDDEPKDESATYTASVNYELTLTDQMVELFDVEIKYYDPNANNEVSEKLTTINWAKNYTVTKLPAKAYLVMSLTQKPGATVAEGGTFKYSRCYHVDVIRYKNNQQDGVKSSSSSSTGTMAADKFPLFLEKYCGATPCIKSSTIIVSADSFNVDGVNE